MNHVLQKEYSLLDASIQNFSIFVCLLLCFRLPLSQFSKADSVSVCWVFNDWAFGRTIIKHLAGVVWKCAVW